MKKIIICFFISSFATAQIAIGKENNNPAALLDFPAGTTKGIILPAIVNTSNMASAVPGTLVFDRASLKVRYNNGFWRDLTDGSGVNPPYVASPDQANAKVVLGSDTSAADGVLVLESNTKALVLPHITNPVTNVKSPVAGMICYDPGKKMMMVYDGQKWYFWN